VFYFGLTTTTTTTMMMMMIMRRKEVFFKRCVDFCVDLNDAQIALKKMNGGE